MTVTGIAEAGKDQALTAVIHSLKVCFRIFRYQSSRVTSSPT